MSDGPRRGLPIVPASARRDCECAVYFFSSSISLVRQSRGHQRRHLVHRLITDWIGRRRRDRESISIVPHLRDMDGRYGPSNSPHHGTAGT